MDLRELELFIEQLIKAYTRTKVKGLQADIGKLIDEAAVEMSYRDCSYIPNDDLIRGMRVVAKELTE